MSKEQKKQVENVDKYKNQKKDEISILDIMKVHSGWIIAVLTFFSVIILAVANFIRYIQCMASFSYYGLNIGLYQFEDASILYSFIYSLACSMILLTATFCFAKVSNSFVRFLKKILYIFFILIANIFLAFSFSSVYSIDNIPLNFFACILTELAMKKMFLIIKKNSDIDNENPKELNIREELRNLALGLVVAYMIIIAILCYSSYQSAKLQKEYRIIDDNKAIVYTTRDYYLTLDCKIEGENLILYKGAETKIDTDSVHSELHTYKKVFLK